MLSPHLWGCTGFDGDEEAGSAGGGAWPPKNRQLYKLKNNDSLAIAA